MAYDSEQHGSNVRRDAGVSVLLGPLRLAVSTLGTLLLLRIVLIRAGMEVVGLWSALNIMTSFILLLDVGFSQVLSREIHVDDNSDQSARNMLNKQFVGKTYWMLFWILVLPATLVFAWLMPSIPYNHVCFAVSLVLIAWGAVFQLQWKLDASVLSALQENSRVQTVGMLGMILSLAVAIAGACLDMPIEGFALGSFLASGMVWWLLRRRVTSRGWTSTMPKPQMRETLKTTFRLARAGGYFYSISIGSVLREPCFRLIIASLLGVKALGAYAIGFRASVATRDCVAGGFQVLYPALASLHRAGNRKDIESLQVCSMVFLITIGSVALGCVYGFAEPILLVLLGSLPEGVVSATRILLLWNLITLFNIPFDYLLHATGHERDSATSLWVHTLAILILCPLGIFLQFDLTSLLVYWTVTSLATQLIIFYYVQKKLNGFWPIVKMPPVLIILLLALFYWVIVLGWVAQVHAPAGSLKQAVGLANVLLPASMVFIGLAYAASHRLFEPFWRKSS